MDNPVKIEDLQEVSLVGQETKSLKKLELAQK